MILGVNKIHLNNKQDTKILSRFVLDYAHLLNMVKILFNQTFDKKDYHITNIMKSANNLRALCCNQKGGKNHKLINDMRLYFKNNPIYLNIIQLYSTKCNEKIAFYVFQEFVKDLNNQYKNKTYSFPKAKKITKINRFSFNLDKSKYKIEKEKNKLLLKLGKKKNHREIFINYNNLDKNVLNNLDSIKICYILGHIEVHFCYKKEEKISPLKSTKKNKKQVKFAGLDLGLNRTFTLFVDDKNTNSISFDGQSLIKYNCDFNYKISKTQRLLNDNGVIDTITNDKGGIVPIYSPYATHFKKVIKNLNYHRGNYYDDVFHKLSKQILEYCKKNNVTDLVVSSNLSFAKVKGDIKMRKKTKQKFYQIPFGRLIKYLKLKKTQYDINIHDIDEAYTSKTSPFVDINKILKKVEKNKLNQENKKLSSTVYGGIREGSIFYVNGKGRKCKMQLHADCVGAYNHCRLVTKCNSPKEVDIIKFITPILIKSTEDFTNFLEISNVDVEVV